MLAITLVSMPLFPGDKSANLTQMESSLAAVQREETPELVVFGEANISGGFWRNAAEAYRQLAERIPEGGSCQMAAELAQKYGKWLCAGLIEVEDGRYFVTHFVCSPQGYVGKQRKLFAASARNPNGFANGQSVEVMHVAGCRCVVLACGDVVFPEPAILAGLVEPALVVVPIDCHETAHEERLRACLATRANDLGAHVVAAFGHDAGHPGREALATMAASCDGRILCCHRRGLDQTVTTRLKVTISSRPCQWLPAERRFELLTSARTLNGGKSD